MTERERDIDTISANLHNRRLVRKWYLDKLGERQLKGSILEQLLGIREKDGESNIERRRYE